MDHDANAEAWGWKPEFHASWAAAMEKEREGKRVLPARVTARGHHRYEVIIPDLDGRPGFPDCPGLAGRHEGVAVSGRFRYDAEDPGDYPVVGDWVLVDPDEDGIRIRSVLRRRSALTRGRAGRESGGQVLAANIDTLLLVFALDGGRNFLPRLLERSLVAARNSGAVPCILLNKADLASEEDRERAFLEAEYAAPSVPVLAVSARTGEGLDDLRARLSPGETIGMLGKSGVGKSALVNALARCGRDESGNDGVLRKAGVGAPAPDASAREGGIRPGDLRGRHTTTASRLYRLSSGLLLIDGPGIRELKIWGSAEGLEGGFPELAALSGRCRFRDCGHSGEPGCAVLEALDSGELEPSRYLSYLELSRERDRLEKRTDERARRGDKRKWKQISKQRKALKQSGR